MINEEELERRPIGWLDPNGKFYPCDRTEHAKLAIELVGSQEAAFQSGWIACLRYEIACGFGIPAEFDDCTTDQIYWLINNGYGEFVEE